MNALFLLLPLALLVAGIMLALFIWAVRSGQFDDLETPAMRVLFDDTSPKNKKSTPSGQPGEAATDSPADAPGRERS